VVTVIVARSSRGYCRTLSELIACRPAMMMTRLTTMANTGRRMKMSVSFMAGARVLHVAVTAHGPSPAGEGAG
jgi:hypothetical protein